MSSEWPLKPLNLVADEVTVGYVGPMASEYVESGVPFLRSLNIDRFAVNTTDLKFVSAEFHRRIKKSALRPGDVAIVRTGKPGTCAVIPDWLEDANCSDLVIVRCGVAMRPRFLCYWVNSIAAHHIASHTVGAVQQHFNVGAAKTMGVATPSVREQDQVVEVLGSLDDRIALLRETNVTLEAIAQALFKSWFVDFDPVRAKQQGLAPAGMDEATAALFPDSFEESAQCIVPRAWVHVNLRDAVSIFDSRRVPLAGQERAQRRGPYPYYGAAALMDSVDDFLFEGVHLLIGEDGSVVDELGFPITQYVWGKFWVNNHAHVLQGKNGVCTEHVMLSLRRTNIQPFVTGAVQAKLSQTNMWRISFLMPSREVAECFGRTIAPLYERFREIEEQAQTLATLRDTLLPRLISGQLRLPEAEAQVG